MNDAARPRFDFSRKAVLVTGGTSGIGEAVAESFAASGANVVITGRDEERGAAIKKRLASSRNSVEFIAGDIRDPVFCATLVSGANTLLSGLDIVVNSAGVIYHAAVDETSDEHWSNTFDVNVNGTFFVCRAAVGVMKRKGGVIVNIASDAALSGSPHLAAYCASKGAVLQLSRAMAIDHAADGIRVIPVCPGDVDTPMLRGEFSERGLSDDEGLRESAAAVPLQRVCTAAEVADMVLFAASDSSRFVTGYPLVIDGGGRA